MDTIREFTEVRKNYYALLLAITKNETATKALSQMGISPDEEISWKKFLLSPKRTALSS